MRTSSRPIHKVIEPETLYVDPEEPAGLRIERLINGRYELIRPLGEGGFSWVFLARHAQIPSLRVAVKIMKTTDGADPRALKRLEREANMTALSHGKNTVKVLDMGVTNEGHPFLALEFVRGIPLRHLLALRGPLDDLSAAHLGVQILEGLQEAHSQGLVHRDLKPSNIFVVQSEGERASVCLLDFGIARFADTNHDRLLTTDGEIACTPHYASPEALGGKAEARSDLYSVGLILAELLDGRPVVHDDNTFIAASKNLSEDNHALSTRVMSSPLAEVITRAIHKKADERFSSAETMLQALRSIQSQLELRGDELTLDVVELIAEYNDQPETDPSTQWISMANQVADRHTLSRRQAPYLLDQHTKPSEVLQLEYESQRETLRLKRLTVVLAFVLLLTGILVAASLYVASLQGAPGDAASAAAAALPTAAHVEVASANDEPLVIDQDIDSDTVWREGQTLRLRGTVFVKNAASLTIEPGVTVLGETGAALIVTPNATLHARGRVDAPITFTSARGDNAAPGDWGGVVLLGDAPTNRGRAIVEGVRTESDLAYYGGDDVRGSCGVLEYVRIAWAGYEVFANNELNGLTMAGCGEGTIVRYLHVHGTLDDAVEVFGGTPDLKYVLITEPGDDGLDWDEGWQGRAQFIAISMKRAGDNAIEADSNIDDHDALPRSMPTIANLSIFGPKDEKSGDRAMVLRRGTGGHFVNTLITGFANDPIDVRDDATVEAILRGEMSFRDLLIWGDGAAIRFADESVDDDDKGFDEATFFESAAGTRFNVSPGTLIRAASGVLVPEPAPHLESTARLPEDEFFERGARYIGAFRPGVRETWAEGWTLPGVFD